MAAPFPLPEVDNRLKHLSFGGVAPPCRRHPNRPARTGEAQTAPHQAVETEEELDSFIPWLMAEVDLDAGLYRSQPLTRRLPACLRALRVSSPGAAREKLTRRPELLQVAINALLLGVTEFFRDAPVFDLLRELLRERALVSGRWRIWSVGCSDGSELYSAAILLSELGRFQGSELIGTDCRPEAIQQAERGVYAEPALRGLAPALRQRYFIQPDLRPQVVDSLRSCIRFRVQDLFQQPEPGPWDIILWRNMAIYLRTAAARTAWRRLADELRPGGLLVTGRAERPDFSLPLRRLASCIYLRTKP